VCCLYVPAKEADRAERQILGTKLTIVKHADLRLPPTAAGAMISGRSGT
jgi:hypothetical protein